MQGATVGSAVPRISGLHVAACGLTVLHGCRLLEACVRRRGGTGDPCVLRTGCAVLQSHDRCSGRMTSANLRMTGCPAIHDFQTIKPCRGDKLRTLTFQLADRDQVVLLCKLASQLQSFSSNALPAMSSSRSGGNAGAAATGPAGGAAAAPRVFPRLTPLTRAMPSWPGARTMPGLLAVHKVIGPFPLVVTDVSH